MPNTMRKYKARLGKIHVNGHKQPFVVTYAEPNLEFRRMYSKDTMTVPIRSVLSLIEGHAFTVEGVPIQAKTSDKGLMLSSESAQKLISWNDVVAMVEGQTIVI